MKKLKLFIISLCLCLAGCNKVQSTIFNTNSNSDTTEVAIDPAKRNFPVEEITNYYKDQLKENIDIPTYDLTRSKAYFDSELLDMHKQFRIYVYNTTQDEFTNYINKLMSGKWKAIDTELTDATLVFANTRAKVDFYKCFEELYITIIFTFKDIIYDALQIIKDVVISQFGFIEDGIILEPDEYGIIRSTKDIVWNLKDFTDSEEHTKGECLIKALHDLLALAVNGGFPGYLFYDWYNTPIYNEDKDIAEVYLGTYNLEYVLYMYSYYDEDQTKITFMTGPRAAFPQAFEE